MSQYLEHDADHWQKIEHIVVLMLENRSFDNLLGWLYDGERPPRDQYFEGLSDDITNPLSNVDSDGNRFIEQVGVRRNGQPPKVGSYAVRKNAQYSEDYCQPDPDPGEGYRDTNQQLFGTYAVDQIYAPTPTMQGFVDSYKDAMLYGTYSFGDAPTDPRSILTAYTAAQTPVLSSLAQSYAVCDQWFCSVPSQTWPNRAFAFAATCEGHVNNRPDWVITGRTLFDQLSDADVSWKVYGGVHYDSSVDAVTPFSLTRIMLSPEKAVKYGDHFDLFDDFYLDLQNDSLPAYSFLEPQFGTVTGKDGQVLARQNDQHPPSDIRDGEQLIAAVYEALKASKAWEKTLLVITYDEHGGCHDHYAPPSAKAPVPAMVDAAGRYGFAVQKSGQAIPRAAAAYPIDDRFGFRFDRYGVRVPTVLVSPWIEAGTVARPRSYFDPAMLPAGDETARYFDHTSVIASVRNCFGLVGCLTDRDRYAPDLSCVLTLDTPRTDSPTVTPLAVPDGDDRFADGSRANTDRESHLVLAISDHLAGRTGLTPKEDEAAIEHVVRSYQRLLDQGFVMPVTTHPAGTAPAVVDVALADGPGSALAASTDLAGHIDGIGPKLQQALNGLGVKTLGDLAGLGAADITRIDRAVDVVAADDRTALVGFVAQAQALLAG